MYVFENYKNGTFLDNDPSADPQRYLTRLSAHSATILSLAIFNT